MNLNEHKEFLIQPHELQMIAKVLRSKRITVTADAVCRFIVAAIYEKCKREFQVNHNDSYAAKLQQTEALLYAGAK